MTNFPNDRRQFLKNLSVGAVGAAVAGLPTMGQALAATETAGSRSGETAESRSTATTESRSTATMGGTLQVWSCGGLAEAMQPAHAAYTAHSGTKIVYTGAFAGALGKSLLSGSGRTDVFGGRVLALAQNLRKAGKMVAFKPLCFTSYVVVVPKGNPANIHELSDLARPGVRVAMAREASPPGGAAVMGILKAADLTPKVLANVKEDGSCIQRVVESVCKAENHAMIVERRITCVERFAPHLEIVEIPEKFFPAGPLAFTLGIMTDAPDKQVAEAYVEWMVGAEGQAHFAQAGFIPAISPKGQELIEKLGVKDVA